MTPGPKTHRKDLAALCSQVTLQCVVGRLPQVDTPGM